MAHGPALEVFHTVTACKVAAWHFGAITKDEGCDIDVITEYKHGNSTALLIGICTGTANAVLCLFDVQASKVLKAIAVPHRVYKLLISTFTHCSSTFDLFFICLEYDV